MWETMWETLPAWGQIFESYCGSVIATMFIGSTLTGNVADAILLPVVIISIGLVASIAGILSMSLLKVANSAWALRIAPAISLLVLFTGAWFVVSNMNFGAAFSFRMGPFWAMTLGSLVGLFTGAAAEYYTST